MRQFPDRLSKICTIFGVSKNGTEIYEMGNRKIRPRKIRPRKTRPPQGPSKIYIEKLGKIGKDSSTVKFQIEARFK